MSVWLKAAELVDADYVAMYGGRIGCCQAIAIAEGAYDDAHYQFDTRHGRAFVRWFRPDPGELQRGAYYWTPPWTNRRKDRTARVIALCLMDCLEKDGQL